MTDENIMSYICVLENFQLYIYIILKNISFPTVFSGVLYVISIANYGCLKNQSPILSVENAYEKFSRNLKNTNV